MLKKKTFSLFCVGAALSLGFFLMLGTGAAVAQGYPVVVPASSSGAASRAIVQINQSDIYNNIANANNTANYAVGVGSNAQITANYAANVGSAAQGAADRAFAEATTGGLVTKVASTQFQSGNNLTYVDFMCVKGHPPSDPRNTYPFFEIYNCPAGSGPYVLSNRTPTDQP